MPDYRRMFQPGGTFFFTLVTHCRVPLFSSAVARTILGQQMREQRAERPFETVAIVLLPDHLHVVWTLPQGDSQYSQRLQAIKAKFSHDWLSTGASETSVTKGYAAQRRRGVWQPRFMEHTINDETELQNHVDYIHYNPVKHGYVKCPGDWQWSSFMRFVAAGEYEEAWGCSEQPAPQIDVDEDLLE